MAQLVKNLPAMQEDPGSIPGLGRSPAEGTYSSILAEATYSGILAWSLTAVHGITESDTREQHPSITQGPRGLGRRLQRGSALALPILSHQRYVQSA